MLPSYQEPLMMNLEPTLRPFREDSRPPRQTEHAFGHSGVPLRIRPRWVLWLSIAALWMGW